MTGPGSRLLLPALGAWAGAAVATTWSPRAVAGAAGLTLLLALAATRSRSRLAGVLAAALVCAAGGVLSAGLRGAARHAGPLPELARQRVPVTVEAVVTADPVARTSSVVGARRVGGGYVVALRVVRVEAPSGAWRTRHPVTLLGEGTAWSRLLPGSRLRVRGSLAPPRAGDRVAAVLRAARPPEWSRPPPWWQRGAARLRAGLHEAAEPLPARPRGLLPGLVVGDTSALDPGLREDFRRTGLSHLTAVSGANVAVVLAAVVLLCRRCGLHPRLVLVLSGLALLGFVVLARPSPSVLRAAVTGGLVLLATATGRGRRGLDLLCGAVLGLVLAVPSLARSPGFALSTSATAGLVLLAPRWRAGLSQRWPRWLADAVAVPLAAQVACAPVLVLLSGRVSLVAVPANLLAMPAAAAATVLGVAAAVLSVPCAPLARLAARAAGVPTGLLVWLAEHGARVPAGELPWPSGWWGAVLLCVALAAAARLASLRVLQRPLAVAGVALLVGATGVRLVAPGWPPPGWVLVACDVGQGDGLVLRAGGGAVVVDTGPDAAVMDRCLADLGVHEVRLVVLTHLHADHVEGLPGVLRQRRVGEVLVGPLDEPAEERDRVAAWTRAAGVPVRRAAVGEVRAVGDLRVAVLGPAVAFRGTGSDPNNSSLVLRVTIGRVALLLTGDIEPPAQRAVLATGSALRATVLKTPHHGSDRQTDELLRATSARLAITSAGAGNPYGHPSARTLTRLRKAGMRSYRTDVDGAVAIVLRRGRVSAVGRTGRGDPPLARAPAVAPIAFAPPGPGAWCPVG